MKTPDWVTDYIAYWKPLLFLQEWTITTEVVEKPGDMEGAYCHVVTEADYLRAKIQFAAFIPQSIASGPITHYDKSMWERYILHELIHIRTAAVVDFARDTFSRGFSTGEYMHLDERLRIETERMTTLLTETLFNLRKEVIEANTVVSLLVNKDHENEVPPDPNLVHPGDLVVVDMGDGTKLGYLSPTVQPGDMSEQIKTWEDNLKKSMEGEENEVD